jgi:hypothetical protein
MSINLDTRIATIPVSASVMDRIRGEYDVFTRPDFSAEVILDTCGFTPDESPITDLANASGASTDDLCDTYLVLYHDEDLDADTPPITQYEVSVRRVAFSECTFTIEAGSEHEAEEKALTNAPNHQFSDDNSDYTVEMCKELD